MRRVIFNQKGGVGKSSITCNLAAISASRGFKTLVIDLDVQGNASYYLGHEQPLDLQYAHDASNAASFEGTIVGLFRQSINIFSGKQDPLDYVRPTEFNNLSLMASSPALDLMERELESRYKIYKFRDALIELEKSFDHIYVDTPPSFNFYSKSALIAAHDVLIPFDCDTFSRRALDSLLQNILELQQDHNPDLRIGGVIVNQYHPQARLPGELIEEMKEQGLPIIDSFISSSVKMKESHRQQKPLTYLAPRHKLSREFELLFDALNPVKKTLPAEESVV